jgi:ferrous iron transport protein B
MAAEVNPLTGEKIFNFASGISFYCFTPLPLQCASTLAVTKETNSWKNAGQLILCRLFVCAVAIPIQILKVNIEKR